jgi:hypothetical protein
MDIVQRKSNLLEIILALSTSGRFAGCLDRWQEKRYQHADNGDDDQ